MWVKILVACNGVGEIFFSEAYNRLQHLVRFLDSSEGEEDDQFFTRSVSMDYINLELEQLHRKNKIGPTCNPQASTWMIASCSRRFGVLGGKDVLEDQNLSLMKDYKEIKDLPIQNGFAVDEICQKMTANDDHWETYIKVTCFLISNVARIEDFPVLFPMVVILEYPIAWTYSSAFETTQTLQPWDRGPERPVRVCTSPDSWQLVITAKGFWQASSKLEKAG
uniref:Myb/SANT-like domain-containing protein n=1 Tax=Quercus lobata TaxID=97700 RepID=A0A7N2KPF5_QUELO